MFYQSVKSSLWVYHNSVSYLAVEFLQGCGCVKVSALSAVLSCSDNQGSTVYAV